MNEGKIVFVDAVPPENKRVLLRVDFNVSLNAKHTIANDERIRQSIPTIQFLLHHGNTVILISHLGRPKQVDPQYSLKVILPRVQELLPNNSITFADSLNDAKEKVKNQKPGTVVLLENIRFHPEEESNDSTFSKELAELGDVYVNDAFAVSNRNHASVSGITKFLPSFGGLLLKKEISIIGHVIQKPKKPFVAVIGGAKIKDKMNLIQKLTETADELLVGGGLANTFLAAQGFDVGKSLYDKDHLDGVRRLFFIAAEKNTIIRLPTDVIVGKPDTGESQTVSIQNIPVDSQILDIGPETQKTFQSFIAQAKTIVWNGPMGYVENVAFRKGTDTVYNAIVQNKAAVSIVGGGDTITALSHKDHLQNITHISTGGGAMLEFIEKGTLPGIEVLKR